LISVNILRGGDVLSCFEQEQICTPGELFREQDGHVHPIDGADGGCEIAQE